MRTRVAAASLLAAALFVACEDTPPTPGEPSDPGPPRVREDALVEHVRRLDGEDLRRRPAGSRAESLAGTYVLGNLESAGYATILDPVPVADLVRSTNIVAVPPAGGAPSIVVTVSYDTPARGARSGGAVAAFLEAARSLRAADPAHEVQFVALGAEHAEREGGRLGSRRLARDMLDRDVMPLVITIGEVEAGAPVRAAGDRADDFLTTAHREEEPFSRTTQPLPPDDVFARAEFEHLIVRGDHVAVARVLLAYLQQAGG